MKTLLLRDSVPWFGNHTGYEPICSFLPSENGKKTVYLRKGNLVRYLGSAYGRWNGRSGRGALDFSEMEFLLRRRRHGPDYCHIIYMEQHLELLKIWPKAAKNLIGTIHLPASVWTPEQCDSLSHLASALVLYKRDISFFEQQVGRDRVRFVHLGADTDFFYPDRTNIQAPPRILYSGVYLRNEAMLVRVLPRILERYPAVRFDLLVPAHHRKSTALAPLLEHPAVTWHAGLNDEQLRHLYQQSSLLLLPMNDSGANTAVVEALSSGLPIVTTDVGGIRDYGGDSIFPLVANNDDGAMVELVQQYLSRPNWRNEIGQQCRQFAEQTLAWPLVAQLHMKHYNDLAK